jgi:hypothetical protein
MSLGTISLLAVMFVSRSVIAQNGLDLLVASEETKTLPGGQYEFRSVQIADRGKLVLTGGVTIATQKLSSGEGATIQFDGTSLAQENISISTFDASGLRFLYINADGKSGKDQVGIAGTGPNGRDGKGPGYSVSYPGGRSSGAGGAGAPGAVGGNGGPAANVSLYLPNLRVGSLLRIHAIGGTGGKGQQGGQGGKGGEGATAHPASAGGPGGPGGQGGAAGNAGKISVYLIVADAATEQDKDAALQTLRLEYANSAGNPGAGGLAGPGGPGGSGAPLGGDGTRGSGGSLGAGGGQGAVGIGPATQPDQRWVVTDILTQSQYAQQYTQTLQKIRAAGSPN